MSDILSINTFLSKKKETNIQNIGNIQYIEYYLKL